MFHKESKTPTGRTVLEFEHDNRKLIVSTNTYYPVEADFYILFLPGHKVMMEALQIMGDIQETFPISFDHAQFLVTEFFAQTAEEYCDLEEHVEQAFQEVWPHAKASEE